MLFNNENASASEWNYSVKEQDDRLKLKSTGNNLDILLARHLRDVSRL